MTYPGTWTPLCGPWARRVRKDRPAVQVRDQDGAFLLPVWRERWFECLLSAEDAWALERNWFCTPERYVFCNKPSRKIAYLHRLVASVVRSGSSPNLETFFLPSRIEVDHNDRNPLNNHRSNLTLVDKTLNNYNHDPALRPCGTGVTWDENRQRYYARVKHGGQTIHIGRFQSLRQAEAAVERKRFALERARMKTVKEVPF